MIDFLLILENFDIAFTTETEFKLYQSKIAMLIDELLTSLFDGQAHILAESMATWLTSSRRFTDFVQTHHTKIRKKIRTTQDAETLRDLQLELETAYLLLRERSLSLKYEPQHPDLGRSPDFAVNFTTSLTFMVEVTRMRGILAGQLFNDRFTDIVCSKLGQLLTQRSNLLVVGLEAPHLTQSDVHAIMLRLQKHAEGNDASVVQRYRFRDRTDFFNRYQRLSGILVRGIPHQVGASVILWDNPQTKYPLPAKVRTAVSRSHTL